MQADYWHERWQTGDIAFHRAQAHDFLVRHFSRLGLNKGDRVFVPLCGMSVDMKWLREQGFQVVGVELHCTAVEGFFEMIGEEAQITQEGHLNRFTACEGEVVIYQGDLFELNQEMLGPVDGVYDRGAIVALPQMLRSLYAPHMLQLAFKAPQLIVAYDYDQSNSDGPPFSVPESELQGYYGDHYQLEAVEKYSSEGLQQKRGAGAAEIVWCLIPKKTPEEKIQEREEKKQRRRTVRERSRAYKSIAPVGRKWQTYLADWAYFRLILGLAVFIFVVLVILVMILSSNMPNSPWG